MIKVSKNKKSHKRRELFSTNTNNFLAFFIVFEWGRILESAMDKFKVKRNAKLCPNYFYVNVSILAVVCHGQISKTHNFA